MLGISFGWVADNVSCDPRLERATRDCERSVDEDRLLSCKKRKKVVMMIGQNVDLAVMMVSRMSKVTMTLAGKALRYRR